MLHLPLTADVLEPTLAMIRKALTQRSTSIDLAVYEGLGTFLSETAKSPMLEEGRRRAANQSDKENDAEENEADLEQFLQEIILALTSHDSSRLEASPENVRKSRVRLGLTLVERKACNASSRVRLASILGMWLDSERSRPLREDLEKARDTNARLMHKFL